MSRVIRLNDLITQTDYLDTIYLNGIVYWDNLLEASKNPLVHIDLVEIHQEEGYGAYGTTTALAYTYHVTIV
jgi:hypothetical protein